KFRPSSIDSAPNTPAAAAKQANANSANATQMKLVIVFMCLFPFISVLRILHPKVTKIGSLYERALRSRLTLREEGQVEPSGETPNRLSAGTTLAAAYAPCQ